MVRRYEEAVEVRTVPAGGAGGPGGAGGTAVATAPDAFVWRGRLYVVRAVLDHWQERRAWWRDAREGRDVLTDARERQVWRVEASPGRLAGVGVYDLGLDHAEDPDHPDGSGGSGGSGGHWRLLRVAD